MRLNLVDPDQVGTQIIIFFKNTFPQSGIDRPTMRISETSNLKLVITEKIIETIMRNIVLQVKQKGEQFGRMHILTMAWKWSVGFGSAADDAALVELSSNKPTSHNAWWMLIGFFFPRHPRTH